MVTHSVKAASTAGRVLFIKDGRVFHQIYKGNLSEVQMYQKISDAMTAITAGGADVNSKIYGKLAVTNLKNNNEKLYSIYFGICIFCKMYFIMDNLYRNRSLVEKGSPLRLCCLMQQR